MTVLFIEKSNDDIVYWFPLNFNQHRVMYLIRLTLLLMSTVFYFFRVTEIRPFFLLFFLLYVRHDKTFRQVHQNYSRV